MIKKNISTLIEKINILNIEYDIFLSKPSDTDKKYNQIDEKIDDDIINKIKILINSKSISDAQNELYNINEINMIKQWWKLYELFQFVPSNNDYDYIVRMRPDIELLSTSNELESILLSLEKEKLYVPITLMHDKSIIEKYNQYNHINDQFCICDYDTMKKYVNFYNYMKQYQNYPFISEILLFEYLNDMKINIVKIDIKYKLNLSQCNVIGISGDSGSGKSTLLESIQKLLIFDNYIKLETDRYHKWERGNENWKLYTHLDPCSNYIEKMSTDIYNLKIGIDTYQVDYDHNTGKFTDKQKIDSGDGIIFCGLHTLHSKDLLNIIDIKIYVDTQDEIKKIWKLNRDIIKRGYTYEKVIKSINDRESDYNKYIKPQMNNADIIIKYYCQDQLDVNNYEMFNLNNIMCNILIEKTYFNQNKHKLEKCKILLFTDENNYYALNTSIYNFVSIKQYIIETYKFDNNLIDQNVLCVMQLLILILLYN